MNPVEKALFELRADMARSPGELNRAGLESLLSDLFDESDRNLAAAAEFFGLDPASLEEKAAIMQYDGGLSRVTANRLALTGELRRIMPNVSDRLCRWFAQNAAVVMDCGGKHGLSREQIAGELSEYFRRKSGVEGSEILPLLERAV